MKWDAAQRLRWLVFLISGGLISSMLISSKLWLSDRDFPHFPVWGKIPQFPTPLDQIFLITFVFVLLLLAFKPKRRIVIAALAFILVFALQDQMRWQPWFYQYALMLLPLGFSRIARNPEDNEKLLGLEQIVVIMIYVWGGINKCQPGFISVYEQSLMKPIYDTIETGFLRSMFGAFGYLIPPVEILAGIGLFFRKTRFMAILAVVITHLSILILLGPVKGHISNPVVWPWNIVMLGMVICLFGKMDTKPSLMIFRSRLAIPGIALFILLFAAPPLFYAGKWDRYLSFHLYSGYQKRMLVKIEERTLPYLPEDWRPYLLDTNSEDGHKLLSPSVWANKELKVPLISEWRILRAFSQKLCANDIGDSEWVFYVDYRHFPNKAKGYYNCSEIDEMGRRTIGP